MYVRSTNLALPLEYLIFMDLWFLSGTVAVSQVSLEVVEDAGDGFPIAEGELDIGGDGDEKGERPSLTVSETSVGGVHFVLS